VYGARPLRRFIQREIETRVGRALIAGTIAEGTAITVGADGDELIVGWHKQQPDDTAKSRGPEPVAA